MASLNKVLIIGNLTRDPEVKYTPKGTAICDIGLAVNRNYTTDSGEKREEVTFIDVTLWGRVAEVCSEYCKKGAPLFVEGRLNLETWDDKQTGQKRSKLKVVGENIQLLGSKGEAKSDTPQRPQTQSQGRRPSAPPPRPPVDPDLDAPEDDIPFRSMLPVNEVIAFAKRIFGIKSTQTT